MLLSRSACLKVLKFAGEIMLYALLVLAVLSASCQPVIPRELFSTAFLILRYVEWSRCLL